MGVSGHTAGQCVMCHPLPAYHRTPVSPCEADSMYGVLRNPAVMQGLTTVFMMVYS